MTALRSPLSRRRRLLAALWLGLATLAADPVLAVLTVTTLADENDGCGVGACSLREAIGAAVPGETIDFAVTGTILLTVGPLVPATDVVVAGPGSAQLTVAGGLARRLFEIAAARSIELRDLRLYQGRAPSDGDPAGGCVKNLGSLTLLRVVVEGCEARSPALELPLAGGDGGGIANEAGATLLVTESRIVNCRAGKGGGGFPPVSPAGGRGGGLYNAGGARLVRSTVAGNRAGDGGQPAGAGGQGGGIFTSGALRLEESTVSGNASGDGGQFCAPICSTGPDGAGGGVAATGAFTAVNATVSGNAIGSTAIGIAAGGGGLLLAPGSGTVQRLRNLSVLDNSASGAGGGIAAAGAGTARLRHTLLARNLSTGTASEDCSTAGAALVSDRRNLVGLNTGCAAVFAAPDLFGTTTPLDPLAGPLAGNGGASETHALLEGSPARDSGDPAGCLGWDPELGADYPLTADQRGEPRPRDGDGDLVPTCDIGSFEAPDLPVVSHSLAVLLQGLGSGRVTSDPTGIDCPGDCQQVYLEGTTVTLTPAADPGSAFGSWSGDCSGSGGCVVAMTTDRSVGATFLRLFGVSVNRIGAGSGTVTSQPAGIDCGTDCFEAFVEGSPVTLTAVATPPSVFVGWSGDCAGREPCALLVEAARAATARFEPPAIFADGFESGGLGLWTTP